MGRDTKIRAVGYARASTGEQASSLPRQVQGIRRLARANGWGDNIRVYQETHTGLDGPGRRVGLYFALEELVSGQSNMLVVECTDRLARSTQVLAFVGGLVHRHQFAIEYVYGSDLYDPCFLARTLGPSLESMLSFEFNERVLGLGAPLKRLFKRTGMRPFWHEDQQIMQLDLYGKIKCL